ncbi:NTPase [Thermococci archaeon]|nr:MAG: NTPase [Thermococci archaeon]
MRFFVSGMPGVGKTTLAKRIADEIRREGYKVGGIITQEIRSGSKRVGFKVMAIDTGEIGRLAYVGYGQPRLGKYVIDVEGFERVAIPAISRALREANLIVIDEIGPMEFKSNEFLKALGLVLKSEKPLLATVHRRLVDRYRPLGEYYWLTPENRNEVFAEILGKIKRGLKNENPGDKAKD